MPIVSLLQTNRKSQGEGRAARAERSPAWARGRQCRSADRPCASGPSRMALLYLPVYQEPDRYLHVYRCARVHVHLKMCTHVVHIAADVYVCTHVYMYGCTYACMHARMYVSVYVYEYMCMCVYTYVRAHQNCIYISIDLCIHINMWKKTINICILLCAFISVISDDLSVMENWKL